MLWNWLKNKSEYKNFKQQLRKYNLYEQCNLIIDKKVKLKLFEIMLDSEKNLTYQEVRDIVLEEFSKYGIKAKHIAKISDKSWIITCEKDGQIGTYEFNCIGNFNREDIKGLYYPEGKSDNSFVKNIIMIGILVGGIYAFNKYRPKITLLENLTKKIENNKAEQVEVNNNTETQEKTKDVSMPDVEKPQSSSDELSMCLIDPKSGSILYEKDCDNKMNMASTTKIMTAIIGLENCDDENKKITVTKEEIQDVDYGVYANMGLREGEKISYDKIFEGFAVHSACEAGNVIAAETEKYIEQKTGKKVSFIDLMNEKAKELGMENTHFTNTYGESTKEHFTSTKDMCKLMLYCVSKSQAKNSFRNYFGKTTNFVKPATNKNPNEITFQSYTNNSLMSNEGYKLIGKTGYTDEAGQCWVFCAEDSHGNQIIGSVFSGANKSTIANDVQELVRYGFKCLKKISKAKEKGIKLEMVQLNISSSNNSYIYIPKTNTVTILKRQEQKEDERG